MEKDNLGILFDMDGVIVNSQPTHRKAIKKFCDKHDQDISDSFLEENALGRPNKEWIPELFGDMDSDKVQQLSDEKEEIFRDLFNPKDHVIKGIHDFLDKLKDQNIPMDIATSAPMENVNYILSDLSINGYFGVILGPDDIENGKPDPEIYQKAAKALDKKPENCIVIEDSVPGVKAGLNAGAKVVGVTTTEEAEDLQDCDLIVDDFTELNVEDLLEL
jgi:HAD superfamily hydrolase (TIGR01509 family)